MKNNCDKRLCGGTFFTLLLEARKPLMSANGHYAGKKDGLTEYETLIGLARIIDSGIPEPIPTEIKTIQGNASEFKKCINSGGGYFPYSKRDAMSAFDAKIKNNYKFALKAMCDFVDEFIEIKGEIKKDENLVKALVDLTSQDDSIATNQKFYINADGSSATKKEIIQADHFCFEPFLLGIYHYAVVVQDDNEIGKATFNEWCPSSGGGKRTYKGNMGVDWPHSIALTYAERVTEVEAEIVDEIVYEEQHESNEENKTPEEKPAPQMTFNFNVTGNGNSFYNHVDTVNNYYGGKKGGK